MIWTVLEIKDDSSGRKLKTLGRVRAFHQPEALERAYKKYKIKSIDRRINVAVRPIKRYRSLDTRTDLNP